MYWHLASGKWMLEHGALLRADVFSSTVSGQPYSVGEWLGQIVLYLSYLAGGWTGLVILRGLLVASCAFFLTRVALRGGAPVIVAVPVTCAALILSEIVWTDRPHLFTLALFPLMLDVLLLARAGRFRLLLAVPPLILLWTNLHGGYALGLALVGIFTLEALLTRRNFVGLRDHGDAPRSPRRSSIPGSLGLGAAAAHATAPPRFIVEESPPDVTNPAGLLFAAFIIGTLALAMRGGGTLLDLLLLAPLLWLGLSAQRHMLYFAFAAVPFISAALPRAFPPLRAHGSRAGVRIRAVAVIGFGAGVAAMALVALAFVPERAERARLSDRGARCGAARHRRPVARVRLGRLPDLARAGATRCSSTVGSSHSCPTSSRTGAKRWSSARAGNRSSTDTRSIRCSSGPTARSFRPCGRRAGAS